LRPADVDALGRIHGIGPAFLERHGSDVLALVAQHDRADLPAPAELSH
jgi:hypothetical protein